MGVGVEFITPAMFTATVSRVRPAGRGFALGTASGFIDLGLGGGPVIVGLVAGIATIPIGLIATSLVAAAGAVGATLVGRWVPVASAP
jgi:hypothetical protein